MDDGTKISYARDFSEKFDQIRATTSVIQDALLGSPRTNGVGFDERLVDIWKMQKKIYDGVDGVRNVLWVIAVTVIAHVVHHW